jgi:hypothetical protein
MTFVFSIVMLAAFALVAGAIALRRNGGSRMQVALMLLVAAIMIGNVLLWSMPLPEGGATSEQQPR